MRRIVIGMGNPFRRDDGAGLEVARRLRERAPHGVTIVEHDGEPAGLLDAWSGADEAFVIDSVRGTDPGTVHRVQVTSHDQAFDPAARGKDSTHALGLGDAVELARVLDRLPPLLNIIGIEGIDFSTGEGVSPAVERAAAEVADDLARQLGAGEA